MLSRIGEHLMKGLSYVWPPLAILGGASLVAFAEYVARACDLDVQTIRTTGWTVLGPGVAASMLVAWRHLNVFKDELRAALVDGDMIDRMNHAALRSVLIRASTALSVANGAKGEEVKAAANMLAESEHARASLARSAPNPFAAESPEGSAVELRQYVAKGYKRVMTFRMEDLASQIVHCEDVTEYTGIALHGAGGFDDLVRSSILSARQGFDPVAASRSVLVAQEVTIDGKQVALTPRIRHHGAEEKNGSVVETTASEVVAVQKKQAHIKRTLKKQFSLKTDPYIRVTLRAPAVEPNFVVNCEGRVRATLLTLGLCKELRNELSPDLALDQRQHISVTYPGVLPFGQGFILIIHAV